MGKALTSLVVPSIKWDKNYLTRIVAVFGTTISPYLFFWQAAQEAEDVRTLPHRQILKRAPEQGPAALRRIDADTFVGMGVSNVIALAIMVTAAATLNTNNVTDVETSAQAARHYGQEQRRSSQASPLLGRQYRKQPSQQEPAQRVGPYWSRTLIPKSLSYTRRGGREYRYMRKAARKRRRAQPLTPKSAKSSPKAGHPLRADSPLRGANGIFERHEYPRLNAGVITALERAGNLWFVSAK